MSYNGITFALILGVGICTAIYHFFKSRNETNSYSYDHRYRRTSDELQNEQCPICLHAARRFLRFLSCGHIFHEECIKTWFEQNTSCPVCRKPASLS